MQIETNNNHNLEKILYFVRLTQLQKINRYTKLVKQIKLFT